MRHMPRPTSSRLYDVNRHADSNSAEESRSHLVSRCESRANVVVAVRVFTANGKYRPNRVPSPRKSVGEFAAVSHRFAWRAHGRLRFVRSARCRIKSRQIRRRYLRLLARYKRGYLDACANVTRPRLTANI